MNFTTTNPRLTLLFSLLPVMLGRLRLVAAMAGGAWAVGIELGVMARIGLVLIAVVAITLDAALTPPQALASPAFLKTAGGFRDEREAA